MPMYHAEFVRLMINLNYRINSEFHYSLQCDQFFTLCFSFACTTVVGLRLHIHINLRRISGFHGKLPQRAYKAWKGISVVKNFQGINRLDGKAITESM